MYQLPSNITSIGDLFTYTNVVTGDLFGVMTVFILYFVILFSVFNRVGLRQIYYSLVITGLLSVVLAIIGFVPYNLVLILLILIVLMFVFNYFESRTSY
jgi:hypothetical protein